ncbi:MAG: Xaa-Pro peptidase family protein [Pseudomonadota bacterium]
MENPGWPSRAELAGRVARLRNLMKESGQDAALFLQNADILYLAGTLQAEAVFVPSEGDPLVLARPPLDQRVRDESGWGEPEIMPKWVDLKKRLLEHAPFQSLGLELDVLPVTQYQRLAGFLDAVELVDASPLIRRARAVKSAFELEQMKTAAHNLDRIYKMAAEIMSESVSEVELEGRLIGQARAMGHQGLIRGRGFNQEIFFGHILSGPSGLVPAKVPSPTGGTGIGPGLGQGAGFRIIGKNELVSMDLCGTHGGYIVDQTRLFFTGTTPGPLRDVYDRLLVLVEELLEGVSPGKTAGEVYSLSIALAGKYGLEEGFMGLGADRCPFVGHGIGLELDEWPVLAKGAVMVLETGMTFALEPRVFLPGYGVVGLENTYYLTEKKPEVINVTGLEIVEIPRA